MGDEIELDLPKELLLIIFVHGFKGTDSTFRDFPQRLQHNLAQVHLDLQVECKVFPAYETKGELHAAVEKFADWLVTLTVDREGPNGTGGGAGSTRIVLCGHSMGGLLIADAFIAMHRDRPDKKAPLWPKIIAVIAYDTPYFGLHPGIFKHKVAEGIGYVDAASKVAQSLWSIGGKVGATGTSAAGSSTAQSANLAVAASAAASSTGWSKWAPAAYGIGGALIAGAAAGTAYWKRDEIGSTYTWLTDHMKYVGSLWETEALKQRVDRVVDISTELNIEFVIFFANLPPKPPTHPSTRTFVLLPRPPDRSAAYFLPNKNSKAEDEVAAHVGMFDPKTNDGFWDLGLATGRVIRAAVAKHESVGNNEDSGHATVAEDASKPLITLE